MKTPAFRKSDALRSQGQQERGVTMILVALCLVAIIAMAALSIDVVTLYLARIEAQRAADAAALAAARVISISGITGLADPDNDASSWARVCGSMTSAASLTAQAVAQQNSVGGGAPTVTVKYSAGGGAGNADCTPLSAQFGINPLVTVQVQRTNLPTLFSRIWSRATNTVSATATAEAFNPSNSSSYAPGGDVVPVTPRCVKPWIIPNKDPLNPASQLVGPANGAIQTIGIRLNGGGTGIVGESFTLTNACSGPNCLGVAPGPPSAGNYFPALIIPPASAVPQGCPNGDDYQEVVGGCDENTHYACGTPNGAQADLTFNPGPDTAAAVQCMIRQPGQDTIDVSAYPYAIKAGPSNPISSTNQVISASSNIVSLPIYDSSASLVGNRPTITIVGFLQVFIDNVDPSTGNMNVHVLNIAGCGTDASTTLSAPGTSPVPIRLITPR